MLLNRQVFARDPLDATIPNDGVCKIGEPQTPQEEAALRYELSTFVCGGEYKAGLDRIFSAYLRKLDEPEQPAVWISGFYGSGKSHLARVLEFLWRDYTFSDGATARGLADLPSEIRENLQELTIQGKRRGGLWSAAGTLGAGAGDSVRLSLLGILFRSAGLPDRYAAARFTLWLMHQGWYDQVKAGIEDAGKNYMSEMRHLYASPVIAASLLKVFPDFAASETEARMLLKAQFPEDADISDSDMVAVMGDVMALKSNAPGKLPCTLIVLDELQQYINDNPERTLRVQTAIEACSSKFGSLILVVATGQSAMQGNAQLAKLQGRFTMRVSLSDKDVESVVRTVLLRKKPEAEPQVRAMLEQVSGEIDRHLMGTKIAPTSADKEIMAADYPLLPTRRRFMERVLRAADRSGAAGQLRTQLHITQEALREVAEQPLGVVVAVGKIYAQLAPAMISGSALPRYMDEIIRKQDDSTEEGRMRSHLAAAIFLIRLIEETGADLGLRATPDTLADLLVEDLPAGSAALRQRIPLLLQGMVDSGSLMLIGDEYHLQTLESAEWEQDYKARYQKVFADDARIAGDRLTELKTECNKRLKDISFAQGNSKTPRKVELHFAAEQPKGDTGAIPVWIRDEWTVSEKTVREDAQAGGADSATIYVFLPRRAADEVKRALASFAAAQETLQTRPNPATQEGQEARRGMESRKNSFRSQLDHLVGQIFKDALVYQGGGNEIAEGDLRASVRMAAEAATARLYPQFAKGDSADWGKVVTRARQGNGDALAALGYVGEVEKHPACADVLSFVGATGKKGLDVRRHFTAPPYGWPQDAVDGALLTLTAAGQLRAAHNGTPITAPQMDQSKLSQAEFRMEGVTLSAVQRIGLKKLLQDANAPHKPGEEVFALPHYIQTLLTLARESSGEPPLPPLPDVTLLEELRTRAGNELAVAVYEQRDRLTAESAAWRAAKQQIGFRTPRWDSLLRLLKHSRSLPVYAEAQAEADAIRANRSLLASPDPVPPLSAKLTDALRAAIQTARQRHLDAYTDKIGELEDDSTWQKLSEADRKAIRAAHGLTALPELKLGDEADVLNALDSAPLTEWENKTAAIAERVARALLDAAQKLKPAVVRVRLPNANIETEAELDAYLAKVRVEILTHLGEGRPVVI